MQHIAIIMDGNRRFAKAHRLPIWEGHRKGAETIENVVEWVFEKHGIKTLTVYAFSLKNFSRNELERAALMKIIAHEFRKLKNDPRIIRNEVRVRAVGRIDLMPKEVRDAIAAAEEATKHYTKHEFNLAVAYDGRAELVDTFNKLLSNGAKTVDEATIEKNLYLSSPPDLIIRTGGESRLSGFLLWLSSYSEFYFTNTYWPEFSQTDLETAILDYETRERRFGH